MAIYLVEELVDKLVLEGHFRNLSLGLGRYHVIVYSNFRYSRASCLLIVSSTGLPTYYDTARHV